MRKASPGDDDAGFSTTSRSRYAGSASDVEVGRRLEPVLVEPPDVVVHADVAEVHWRRLAVRHQLEHGRVDGVETGRLVRFEHLVADHAGQEGVVDAVHHVALRVAGGEDGLRHHRPGVPGDDDVDVDAGLGRPRVDGLVERGAFGRERLVGDQCDRVPLVAGGAPRPPGTNVATRPTAAAVRKGGFMVLLLIVGRGGR